MDSREKLCNIISVFFVTIISVFAMVIMMGFNGHLFLVDDNLNQFYPIITTSFRQFLRTGRFPVYNFFQQKGMIIADNGYYGHWNFLLFVAWLLEKYAFHHWDCINIYAVLCVIFGNVGMWLLLRLIGGNRLVRISIIGMLTCVSTFFSWGYWYYVFNNYAVLPYLLFSCYFVFQTRGMPSFFYGGLVLVFGTTLGNIQYSFYYYLAFTVISLSCIFITKRWQILKCFCSNICVSLILSLPLFFLCLTAGARRNEVLWNGESCVMPVDFAHQRSLSFAPIIFLDALFKDSVVYNRFVDEEFFGARCDYLFTGFLLPCVFCFSIMLLYQIFCEGFLKTALCKYWEVKRKWTAVLLLYVTLSWMTFTLSKSFIGILLCFTLFVWYTEFKNNKLEAKLIFTMAVLVCYFFFSIYEAGEQYGVAALLGSLPVINQFRYLFKISFVTPFLMAVIAAYFFQNNIKPRALIFFVSIFFVLIGMYNNYSISSSGKHRFYNAYHKKSSHYIFKYAELYAEFEKLGIDILNYRLLPFISSKDTDPWGECFETRMLASNLPTLFGYYSLGGYEVAAIKSHYKSVDKLLTDDYFNYRRLAGVSCHRFFALCKNNDYAREAAYQLAANGVKYCLFDTGSIYIGDFERFVGSSGSIGIKRKISLSNGTVVFELDGVNPLFSSARVLEGEGLDLIKIRVEDRPQGEAIKTSFAWDPKLFAYFDGGEKVALELTKDGNGDAVIHLGSGAAEGGVVCFGYKNTRKEFAVLWGFILSAVSIPALLRFACRGIWENRL